MPRPKGSQELQVTHSATKAAPTHIRRDARGFLGSLDIAQQIADDVITAVSEAAANAVEHGYDRGEGTIELVMRVESADVLLVEIADHGSFISRERQPDRGYGLNIIRAMATTVEIISDPGTRIRMRFSLR